MQYTNLTNEGTISLKTIRDYILDKSVTENDTIILHSHNFDDIVLEHRTTYRQSIPIPFFLLRVLITEDPEQRVTCNRIKVKRNDPQRFQGDDAPGRKKELEFSQLTIADKTIYRCGWCGNVVDYDGADLNASMRLYKIAIIEKFGKNVTQHNITGRCCQDRERMEDIRENNS